jgi:ribosomal protein S18 acetylase RimI-like enzyme
MSTVAPSRLTVRRMQLAEIAELAEVIPEITDAQLANRWREQSQGYRELLVAERDGELVGTVSIAETYRPASLHLFALEVAASRRNEGIGGEIVGWVIDEARRRGLRRVYLEVRTDNPARRLYHRLGFRRVGPAFVNSWWLFNSDGTQTRMEEMSYRMARRVTRD